MKHLSFSDGMQWIIAVITFGLGLFALLDLAGDAMSTEHVARFLTFGFVMTFIPGGLAQILVADGVHKLEKRSVNTFIAVCLILQGLASFFGAMHIIAELGAVDIWTWLFVVTNAIGAVILWYSRPD